MIGFPMIHNAYTMHAHSDHTHCVLRSDGVATCRRLLQMIGLFCKRALRQRRYSAKETYNIKESTNGSQPIEYSGDRYSGDGHVMPTQCIYDALPTQCKCDALHTHAQRMYDLHTHCTHLHNSCIRFLRVRSQRMCCVLRSYHIISERRCAFLITCAFTNHSRKTRMHKLCKGIQCVCRS